jgi:hypothetical protein
MGTIVKIPLTKLFKRVFILSPTILSLILII